MMNPFYKYAVLAEGSSVSESQRSSLKAFALNAALFFGAAVGHGVFVFALCTSNEGKDTARDFSIIPAVTFVKILPSLEGATLPHQSDVVHVPSEALKASGNKLTKVEWQPRKPEQSEFHSSSSSPSALSLVRSHTPESFNKKTQVAVLVATPDYLQNKIPTYPQIARRAGQEGVVEILVVVSQEGAAESVALSRSSSFPVLDDAALRAVSGWRFKPAEVGGVPSRSTILVPVRFELQKK